MWNKEFSEIFNNFAVGIGAILAGLGGLIAFWDWAKRKIIKAEFEEFKNIYSRDKLNSNEKNQGFELIRNPHNGHISIYDKESQETHWIKNMRTYRELGYVDNKDQRDWRNITDEDRENYHDYYHGKDIISPDS